MAGESWYKEALRRLSRRSRQKKFELLESFFKPRPEDLVLDVGASGATFTPYTFQDYYAYPNRIVAGGIEQREIGEARRRYPQARYAIFDGCGLPFPDKSFDLVFSNAVIEHLLTARQQECFAREVMRVGRSWFVTTPNFWFPFESHYHLPLIQFLPREVQRWYNRLFGTHIPKGQVPHLRLLSARDMRRLFPASRIVGVRVTFWPETLVAFHVDPSRLMT
jgi:SAM-dependent methyltransferase